VASQHIHAGNAGLASVLLWHRSIFTPSTQALLRQRSGIAASSRWQCRLRFGFAVALKCLHAGNASLASASQWHRSGFVVSLRQQCRRRSASQWHRSVFTLSMQASLRLRNGFAMASQCLHAGYPGLASALQLHRSVFMLAMRASLGIAEASQRLHAVNVSFASASQWCFSVFTLAMHALCRRPMRCLRAEFELGLRFGFALSSQCLCARQAGLASASQRRRSIFTLAI